jgi:hypothetical protein
MKPLATIAGTLPVGVVFAGKTHAAFELRRAIVADTLGALDEVGGDEDAVATLKRECAQIARQITKLGDIPSKDINTALIEQIDELDFDTLVTARGALAKKPSGWLAFCLPQLASELTGGDSGAPSSV